MPSAPRRSRIVRENVAKIKVGAVVKTGRAPRATGKRGKAWRSYEAACVHMVRQLADRLGVTQVEGKQRLRGKVTRWEIDAKAVDVATGKIVIIEARRILRSGLNQEAVAALAYRISDLHADGVIVVSPLPFQKGAKLVAADIGARHVRMAPDSTPDQWVAQCEDLISIGLQDRVDLNITEELELTVRDQTGAIVQHLKI